ncbi:hypothetical protein SARC_09518 [Sphaeroforma arctica JP610]|uniref:RRM domain-containing protein n=1 Tax=Sphaeroforma arctica JP610 TaxID=667725 RepID=A0A0L0FMP2_9EUKA|nr:hypothetical protein SARC_09518 [Sphaeroforma arctica JP610]KNC78034.1 hypothetical protein SARC_09518 [Sphaeroforma arctica JP610]|eukprot:XP_014151936.1 hypothetical protein SARC_09518 [Sphaeroforma arctica JP610]
MDTEDDSANSGAKRWKQNGQTMDGQESRPHRQKEEFGPSRVIHVRNIPQEATPADIGSVFNQYGSVFTMVQLQARKQAFIEFVNLESAASCVKAETGSITVLGTRVYPSFSKVCLVA